MSETQENTQEPTPEQSTSEEQVSLNISDLAQLKAIIDIAASRGSFKPAEMTAVGTVYNKLSAFLENFEQGSNQ